MIVMYIDLCSGTLSVMSFFECPTESTVRLLTTTLLIARPTPCLLAWPSGTNLQYKLYPCPISSMESSPESLVSVKAYMSVLHSFRVCPIRAVRPSGFSLPSSNALTVQTAIYSIRWWICSLCYLRCFNHMGEIPSSSVHQPSRGESRQYLSHML